MRAPSYKHRWTRCKTGWRTFPLWDTMNDWQQCTTYLLLRGSPYLETGRYWNPASTWRQPQGQPGGLQKIATFFKINIYIYIYLFVYFFFLHCGRLRQHEETSCHLISWLSGMMEDFHLQLGFGHCKVGVSGFTNRNRSRRWSLSVQRSIKQTHRRCCPINAAGRGLTNPLANVWGWGSVTASGRCMRLAHLISTPQGGAINLL